MITYCGFRRSIFLKNLFIPKTKQQIHTFKLRERSLTSLQFTIFYNANNLNCRKNNENYSAINGYKNYNNAILLSQCSTNELTNDSAITAEGLKESPEDESGTEYRYHSLGIFDHSNPSNHLCIF